MSPDQISTTPSAVRRLAVTKQHLAGRVPKRASEGDLVDLVRDIIYVQWDPVPIVAPSHVIAIWSRVGNFRVSDLDRLMWEERKLLLHWIPQASIVVPDDYPIYRSLMERYPGSLAKGWQNHIPVARKVLGRTGLKRRMLDELRGGPLTPTQFKDYEAKKSPDGWSSGSDVSNMLFHLHMRGEVMVVGRQGNQNLYDLTERFFPDLAKVKGLSEEAYERAAAERALRALGTAKPREVYLHFVRGRYQHLEQALEWLAEEGKILTVRAEGLADKGQRYVHSSDVGLLESLATPDWEPRVSLIPPFDNILTGGRLESMFGFEYAREQFLPKAKRRFGTYVLPILCGERFIGRIDPRLDKKERKLVVNSVHAEAGAPRGKEVASKIGEAIERLADFVGAEDVVYKGAVPAIWEGVLR
ncbi:MAG: YcaQ family DNA glycosylase [Nitrososphaerota archaeon]|nr:YcaQ family DNA glycosylase [Nitrososphaerota archaeon]MDG6954442.1 YcaQ family DNA glycosylase [Nitrososphaerota archaeon]